MSPTAPSIPPFLTPSSTAFNQIFITLATREQGRRALAQRSGSAVRSAFAHLAPSSTRSNGRSDGSDTEPFSVKVGTSKENMASNRYGDIIAYDSSRILLPPHNRPSYVNASLIREPDLGFAPEELPRRYWVAAQGPTESTISSFLSLLLSSPTSPAYEATSPSASTSSSSPLPLINLIVQLTPLVEARRSKCAPYFPSEVGEEWILESSDADEDGEIWVRLDSKDEGDGARTSQLSVGREADGDREGRKVVHVEYLGWRDHGVPSSPAHLLDFIRRMNRLNDTLSTSTSSSESNSASPNESSTPAPILLHCSAGVGRTGTYLTMSSLLPLLSLLRSNPNRSLPSIPALPTRHPLGEYPTTSLIPPPSASSVVNDYVGLTVDRIRDQRTTMVQTREQLEFIYEALSVDWENGGSG